MPWGPVGRSPSHSAASMMDEGSGSPSSSTRPGRAPGLEIIMIVFHLCGLEWY